jgi:hypothetical protein|nr:MAG TPA: protein of unknown function DUF859 [Caudoviricetes sp.]
MAISISISLAQTSQSVSGNYSYVSATVKYNKSSTTWNANGAPLTIVVNDSTAWSGDVTFPKGTTSGTLKTVTSIKVPHDSDGTKTVSASATLVSGTNSGTVKASTSKALTRIPRKSTLSVENGTLNTGQTLTVTRQATSFTHTITAKCGSASTTICTKSTSESISFTPPLNWASQNTTGTSLTVTYTITTYSGTTNLGSNSYTKTCSIPSSVKPSVSISVSDAMGYSGTYGGWVQGKSKIAVSLTSSGSYGSTIKSRSTSVDGSKYTSASFTTGAIKGSGTLKISSTVTDSRGRTATDSENIAVLAYSSPIISAVSAARCNSDGSANSSGAYIKVTFSGKVTALDNHNTAAYSLKYKKTADTAYTTVTLSNYANAYTVTNGTYIFAADTISSYDIAVTAADNFSSVSKQTSGSSIKKIWSIWKKKFSIAFGKIADIENSVDFGLPAYFRQGIYFPGNFNSDFIKNTPLNLGTAEEIPNGADLNSYTAPGTYDCKVNATAETIVNRPSGLKNLFKLVVQDNGGTNLTGTQMLYSLDKIYFRYFWRSNANWLFDEWVQIHTDGGSNFYTAKDQFFSSGNYGFNFNNSDVIGFNGIYFNDAANDGLEGLNFPKSGISISGPDYVFKETDFYTLRIDANGELKKDGNLVPVYGEHIGKTLWSGSWKSGSITIPNLKKYRLFALFDSEKGTVILVPRTTSWFRGLGGYISDSENLWWYAINAEITNLENGTVKLIKQGGFMNKGTGGMQSWTTTSIVGIV